MSGFKSQTVQLDRHKHASQAYGISPEDLGLAAGTDGHMPPGELAAELDRAMREHDEADCYDQGCLPRSSVRREPCRTTAR